MNYIYKLSIIILAIALISSCEDPVELDSTFDGPQLVVDAWLTNENTVQTITLTESQDYFDNRLPTPVSDATVTVTGNSTTYTFANQGDGTYTWTPADSEVLGTVTDDFTLNITSGEETYTATSIINRVPEIDSISVYFEDEAFGADDGLYAEVYARDFVGKGDTYWVKSYRNDTLLVRPRELNIIYDAVFDSGNDIDGIYFIRPLRFAINALDKDNIPRVLNIGDELKVEIYSITNGAFDFLQTVQQQTTNGDNTIFALPIANAKSNVTNVATGDAVLGYFNVAAVSRMEKTVE